MNGRTFWVLLLCLAAVNVAARWKFGYTPADRVEWFVFYFSQPISFGLIGIATCWAYRRARKRITPFPYLGILITVLVLFALILFNPKNYS